MSFAERIAAPSYGVQQWPDLDNLWQRIRERGDWYVYLAGEPPPSAALTPPQLANFIAEIDILLRREHDYDYCGIVYADDLTAPNLVKIYDPSHLGSSCGHSEAKLPPRWILTRDSPHSIVSASILPQGCKRWWRQLFG